MRGLVIQYRQQKTTYHTIASNNLPLSSGQHAHAQGYGAGILPPPLQVLGLHEHYTWLFCNPH